MAESHLEISQTLHPVPQGRAQGTVTAINFFAILGSHSAVSYDYVLFCWGCFVWVFLSAEKVIFVKEEAEEILKKEARRPLETEFQEEN